jgi:tetratricopeptide (TPR) repeat protein
MRAVRAAQEALEVFNLESYPEDWAEAHKILWLAYLTLAEIENREENCLLAMEACQERLRLYTEEFQPLKYASGQKDLAITLIKLADAEFSANAKAEDCNKAVNACLESLRIYDAIMHPLEHAEVQMLLWAAYSALAEVEDRAGNCKRSIEACERAIELYEGRCPEELADAKKNLGYSLITLAEIEDAAENCLKAIEACRSAMEYYTVEKAPLEYADILKDLAFAFVSLARVQDKEESCKTALKAYKKAFKIYCKISTRMEDEGDPDAAEVRSLAEKCHRSMEACKGILKAAKRNRHPPSA